ncbi:Kelch motif [Fragilaria crotonensis]|nr:Kelch motif [Fragilaria crotonensis]
MPRLLLPHQFFLFTVLFVESLGLMPALQLQAEWIQITKAPLIVPKRSGHVALATRDGRLLVFGGYIEEGDEKSRKVTDDLWEWKDQGWIEVQQSGEIPGPRLVSAAGLVADTPYLLGGWDPQNEGTGGIILDTVHKLDPNTNEWTLLKDVTLPGGPASRHVCLSLSNNLLLLHTHRCTDHVYLFDGHGFTKQSTTGDAPSSRGLHSAIMLSDTHALIFAGAAQDGNMSNECFVLNTDTWKWNRVEIDKGTPLPSPRASPCLCQYTDHCAIVFGGASRGPSGLQPEGDVWALHLDDDYQTGVWVLLSSSQGPPPRNAATLNLVSVKEDGTKEYLLQGGWAPFVETYSDCFILRIREKDNAT